MIFFTDRDLGALFPQILLDAGLQVQKHDDHFPPNTPDEKWLPDIGRRGWVAISKDRRIRYRPNEIAAVMRSGVPLFLVVGNASHQELAKNFVACINKVERFLSKHPAPFIAKVYQPSSEQKRRGSLKKGRVELWRSYQDWIKSA